MASFMNLDALDYNHGLNEEQLQMARFIEEAALSRIKELLARMGVEGITREDTMQSMVPKMSAQKVSVAHITGMTKEQDGWWFTRNGKAEIHLSPPSAPDELGRVNLQARFLL